MFIYVYTIGYRYIVFMNGAHTHNYSQFTSARVQCKPQDSKIELYIHVTLNMSNVQTSLLPT